MIEINKMFLTNGEAVHLVTTLRGGADGFVVRDIYKDGNTGEEFAENMPYVVSEIHKSPPVKVYDEKIQAARDLLEKLVREEIQQRERISSIY